MRYFEVEFSLGSKANFHPVAYCCMLATDAPNFHDAEFFFKKYDHFFRYSETGYECITDIREISSAVAHSNYNLENEKSFPVFSRS